jgi:dTDP-4-amino-4,6-dideoxygalactose transaminase
LDFDASSLTLGMSSSSRLILRNSDLRDVAQRRRGNYARLRSAIGRVPGLVPLFPDLPEGVCPWVFPVIAPGRSGFHRELRERGVPAVTWGDVIHPSVSLGEFPDAAFLYENVVFLPIHQSLSEAELNVIADVVAEAVGTRP